MSDSIHPFFTGPVPEAVRESARQEHERRRNRPPGRPDMVQKVEEVNARARQHATNALAREVGRRDEYYGLDNWTYREVANFVVDAYRAAGGR